MGFVIHWHESAMELHVFPIPIPPPSPPDSSGSSQCTRPEHLSHASQLGWWSVYFSNKDARRTILPHPSGPSPVSGRWLKHEDSRTLSAIYPDGPMQIRVDRSIQKHAKLYRKYKYERSQPKRLQSQQVPWRSPHCTTGSWGNGQTG